MDEHSYIVRNKARLVVQEYSQEERIDYEETYALVTRLKAIRMLLAFACFKNFKLFQMGVVITVSRSTWETKKQINGVATNLFCIGVIGY